MFSNITSPLGYDIDILQFLLFHVLINNNNTKNNKISLSTPKQYFNASNQLYLKNYGIKIISEVSIFLKYLKTITEVCKIPQQMYIFKKY